MGGNWPDFMKKLFGDNSILFMRAGKGQQPHARLKSKVLQSLAPKRVLALVPDMLTVFRECLDKMVAETEANGLARFQPFASEIPRRVVALPMTGGLDCLDSETSA